MYGIRRSRGMIGHFALHAVTRNVHKCLDACKNWQVDLTRHAIFLIYIIHRFIIYVSMTMYICVETKLQRRGEGRKMENYW